MKNNHKQFLHDIFVTALEGGIGYWSFATKYHWGEGIGKEDLDGFYATIIDVETDNPYWEGEKLINADVIKKGIDRIINKEGFRINSEIRKAIGHATIDQDTSWLDAEHADCIVQAGLFNEIVFG